jgi:hypothetical protein
MRCRLGYIARYAVGVRCWGCVVGVRVHVCCLPSLVGRGRLKDQARLSPVFCSRLLLGISIAGLYHHPPCPMAPNLVRQYRGPVRWQQLNPKNIQSATGARYESYKRSTTFADARAAGMSKMDRYMDVRQGYVTMGRQLFDGEFDSTVRGASTPVIALSQGEGASSDGGSSTHEATPRSELLVSSDGSSYAAPSAGLVPDTRIACVNDKGSACARSKRMRININNRFLLCSYKGPVVWRQLNERSVERTAARARYERYKSCMTFADARAAGMRQHDRLQDIRRGYVKADGAL